MIKLLFFQQGTIIGGAETQLQTLCKHLPANVYDITVATTGDPTSNFFRKFSKNVNLVSVKNAKELSLAVKQFNPDIVQHFHNDVVASALATADYNGIGIEVVHGCINFPNDVTQTDKKYTHHVVAVSDDAKDFFVSALPAWKEHVTVIPNGIDVDRFSLPRKSRKDGPLKILHCGRLCEGDKKYRKIIDSCRTLSVPWELHLVGTGSDQQVIFDYAAKHAPGRVKFYGFRENVEEIYRDVDIYISRSESEGFGLSIAEAAMAGLPICMWNCGGVANHFVHNQHALIANNDLTFVQNLQRLSKYPDVRVKLGQAAQQRAKQDFNAVDMSLAYDRLYRSLVVTKNYPETRTLATYNLLKPEVMDTYSLSKSRPKKILGISNPNFVGVTNATKAWVGDNWAAVDAISRDPLSSFSQMIKMKKPDVLLLGGDHGYLPAISKLRADGFKGKIMLTWHSTFGFNSFAPKDGELLAQWIGALRDGVIDRIGFVRKGMAEAFDRPDCVYFPNKIPPRQTVSPQEFPKGTHIGLMGTGYAWKNMQSMAVAALSVPNSILHVNSSEQQTLLSSMFGTGRIKVHAHTNQADFHKILAGMDCNIQGGFTESFGLTFCESLRLGVPCITTPGVQIFDKESLFIDRNPFNCEDPDNILAVRDKLQYVIKERVNLVAWGNVMLDRQSELNQAQIDKVLEEL